MVSLVYFIHRTYFYCYLLCIVYIIIVCLVELKSFCDSCLPSVHNANGVVIVFWWMSVSLIIKCAPLWKRNTSPLYMFWRRPCPRSNYQQAWCSTIPGYAADRMTENSHLIGCLSSSWTNPSAQNSLVLNEPWTCSYPTVFTRRVVLPSNTKTLFALYKVHLTPLRPFLLPVAMPLNGILKVSYLASVMPSHGHFQQRKSASRKVWRETPFTTLEAFGSQYVARLSV